VGDTKIRFEPMSSSMHVRRSSDVRFAHLVGNSEPMRDLFIELQRAAESEMPVLLSGEAGTGKESVARAIHRQSARRAGAFHVVDCTGTHQQVERGLISAFETAAGGTLYLAQVSEMSMDLQSRLLRVFRNGGPGAVADLRIISSSTVDLRVAVNKGHFDSRLYGSLCAMSASVPPLRQRVSDLPPLVKALLEELGAHDEPVVEQICTAECFERMARYGWPGNVRELREHLRRSVQHGGVVPVGQAVANVNAHQRQRLAPSPSIDISRPIKAGREEWIKHFERLYLADVLESQGGNVTRAAKAAGVDRGHFYRLMMRCGLRS
jgi:DNA-binding NtrC family response regulator